MYIPFCLCICQWMLDDTWLWGDIRDKFSENQIIKQVGNLAFVKLHILKLWKNNENNSGYLWGFRIFCSNMFPVFSTVNMYYFHSKNE